MLKNKTLTFDDAFALSQIFRMVQGNSTVEYTFDRGSVVYRGEARCVSGKFGELYDTKADVREAYMEIRLQSSNTEETIPLDTMVYMPIMKAIELITDDCLFAVDPTLIEPVTR